MLGVQKAALLSKNVVSDYKEFCAAHSLDANEMLNEKVIPSDYAIWRKTHGREDDDDFYKENSCYLHKLAAISYWQDNEFAACINRIDSGAFLSSIPSDTVESSRLLEIGAGLGTRSMIYAAFGYNITVTELNALCISFIRFCKKKYDLATLSTAVSDKYGMSSLPENHFDFVLIMDVIGHLSNPEEFIHQLIGTMKIGASLRLNFDNFCNTSAGDIHKNREVDFKHVMMSLGLSPLRGNNLWIKG